MNPSKEYYTNLFAISEEEMQKLINEGLSQGGDWCDLYFEHTSFTDLVLRDGDVNSGGSHIDFGCGIRVLSGEKTGYAYAETTDFTALVQAARSAGSIAASSTAAGLLPSKGISTPGDGQGEGPVGDKFSRSEDAGNDGRGRSETKWSGVPLRTIEPAASFYKMNRDWRVSGAGEFVPAMRKLEAAIRAKDPRVHKVIAMLSWNVSEIMMYNSLSELTYDTRPCGSLALSVIFMQDGKTEINSVSRSFRTGAEFISDTLLDTLAEEAVKGMDERFEARRPKGGKMPVVMAAGASGILLHEAMGHAFEADFNRKNQSIFSDKMGQRVAKSGINIVDDGTIEGNRGACNFDDEGVPGQKTYMVRDGILTSYLHDRISAKFYGVEPTGNGRRESFRYNPIPRMRCTYMESGSDGSLQDLISSVKKGVYVDSFSNGQVKIGEGDFTFYVKSGFLIEGGRLTMPIKDINIIGNGPQALADISAVAPDLKIDDSTWTCGKEQSVPVSCGIPSVLVNNLIVGGE